MKTLQNHPEKHGALNLPTRLVEAIPNNPATGPLVAFLRRQQSQSGHRTMLGCLRRMSAFCGQSLEAWQPHTLGPLGIQALVCKIQTATTPKNRPWSRAYIAAHEAALSGVLDQCWAFGLLDQEKLARLKHWRRVRVKRSAQHQAAGRYIPLEERKKLWDAIGDLAETPTGKARDRAFLALLLCGLRREETTQLDSTDLQDGKVLRVRGKGGKERHLILENWMQTVLGDWMTLRGHQPGPLLLPVNRHGSTLQRRWSLNGASKRFQEILTAAGVANITPHDARRTFASDAIQAGFDINLIAQWMGHADVRTTALYDRRRLEDLQAVGSSVPQPF